MLHETRKNSIRPAEMPRVVDGVNGVNRLACRHPACDQPITRLAFCEDHFVLSKLDEALHKKGWTVTETGCWEWAGTRHREGYGFVHSLGQLRRAHRAAWMVWVGPVADGVAVLHRCDNPPCIRPEHLFLGSQADNVADMKQKGRGSRKLSDVEVQEIVEGHRSGTSQAELGRLYGVSRSLICHIVAGRKRA